MIPNSAKTGELDLVSAAVHAPAVLELQSIGKRFGGNTVLTDISLIMSRGEVLGVVGPNGAGKSTLLSVIAGALRQDAGSIHLAGRRIDHTSDVDRVQLGICKTNQLPRVFKSLTALENLRIARPRMAGRQSRRLFERKMADVLESVNLTSHASIPGGSLSGGQQKLLDLARAMVREPSVLLADEPTAGVNQALLPVILGGLRAAATAGAAVVFVSHDIAFLRDVCDRLVGLAEGRVVTSGAVEDVLADDRVVAAYLGRRR